MTQHNVADLLDTLRDQTAELELLLALGNQLGAEIDDMHRRIARSRLHALQTVVESVGWPDQHLGEDASGAALDLLVAAATDTAFLRQCLQLAHDAANEDRIPTWHPAVIEDLLALAERGEQTYGTQLRWTGERWEPHPIADPDRLVHRRRQAGLDPLHKVAARFDTSLPGK